MSSKIYLYQRIGNPEWATCDESRFIELSSHRLFATKICYEEPPELAELQATIARLTAGAIEDLRLRTELMEQFNQLKAAISDPEQVFINMKAGSIAKPTLRSMIDLYGEVVNGDEAQLLEIGKLTAENERNAKNAKEWEEASLHWMAERDQLKADIERLNDELSACTTAPGGCSYWRESARLLTQEIERLKGGQGEPVAWAIPDECPHLIMFDDTERENLLFSGAGARSAALKTWEKISMSWNAHLFVRVERNSRDDRYPSATVSASQPAPVPVSVVPEGFMLVERSIWTEDQVESATKSITVMRTWPGLTDRDLALGAMNAAQCKAPEITLADLASFGKVKELNQ